MRRLLTVGAFVVALWSGVFAQASNPPSLQELYEQHRWFELRDAVAGKSVPPLYLGAVASAFNRVADAERYLNQAVREASTPESANEARETLMNLYMRLARSSDIVRVLDDAFAAAPSRSDLRNARQAFESFRRLPNQSARGGQRQPVQCDVTAKGIVLPVVINGRSVRWLFDSAFSHAAMSESEAHMLGISVQGATATAGDLAGGTASMRTAIADRVAIGDSELRNVPVLVFPDSQPPFNEHAPGQRGAIGLPVVLALQGITWQKGGTCQMGSNPSGTVPPDGNLAFDGVTPLIRVHYSGKPLEFVLDTGNQAGTQLWERFARDFPELASAGRRGTRVVHQIGGAVEREILTISEIRLRVGGFDSVLRPATIFSKPVGNDFQHGNLGMDILSQAAEVMIDFRTMSLTVR
jgi:predicted aspartyl protease